MNIKELLEYLDGQGVVITESDGELQDTLEEVELSLFTQIEYDEITDEENEERK